MTTDHLTENAWEAERDVADVIDAWHNALNPAPQRRPHLTGRASTLAGSAALNLQHHAASEGAPLTEVTIRATTDGPRIIARTSLAGGAALARGLMVTERGAYDGRRVWDGEWSDQRLTIIGEG